MTDAPRKAQTVDRSPAWPMSQRIRKGRFRYIMKYLNLLVLLYVELGQILRIQRPWPRLLSFNNGTKELCPAPPSGFVLGLAWSMSSTNLDPKSNGAHIRCWIIIVWVLWIHVFISDLYRSRKRLIHISTIDDTD